MSDAVHNPAHYQGAGGIEAIDVIEAQFGLTFHLATAMKYILRHRRKGRPAQDLAKARWYVNRVYDAEHLPPPEPAMASYGVADLASAFDLGDHAAAALAQLLSAATDGPADDRYYGLVACIIHLDDAIDEAEAAGIDAELAAIDADEDGCDAGSALDREEVRP